jgi:hypothetical protein
MKYFTSGTTLRNLSSATRHTTAAFLLLILGGVIVTILLAKETSGFTAARAVEHYRGGEESGSYAKSLHELLETAHFHAFSMPVVLLIVAHLMGLTRFGPVWKALLISGGFAGALLNLVSPFLLVYGGAGWVPVKLAGNLLLGASLPAMCLTCLCDLYSPTAPRHGEGRQHQ